tara:strand:- start:1109 stop:1756 length:648 start_codon:yes stop_codon:yes gene_type:complete
MKKYLIIFFFIFGYSCSYKNNLDIDSSHYKYSWCNLNDEMDTLDLFKFIKDFELIFNQRKNKQKIIINYLKPEFDVGSYDFLIESTIEVNDKTDIDFNLHDLFIFEGSNTFDCFEYLEYGSEKERDQSKLTNPFFTYFIFCKYTSIPLTRTDISLLKPKITSDEYDFLLKTELKENHSYDYIDEKFELYSICNLFELDNFKEYYSYETFNLFNNW